MTRSTRTAVDYGRKAIEIYERLLREAPHARNLVESLAASYSRLAGALAAGGDEKAASEYRKRAAALNDSLAPSGHRE
jgi:hypothetical protein